jgi:Flp pilus assembly protein TadD
MRTAGGFRFSTLTAIALVGAVSLSACTTDSQTTGSVAASTHESDLSKMSVSQLNSEVDRLGALYEKNPTDKQIGMSYALLLRMTARDEQALAVMRKLVIHHSTDNEILSAYAKALASTGKFKEALGAIDKAQRPEMPDWRLLSAKGAILDQLDRSQEARLYYRQALDIKPNEPTVLSNLGMSYVLTNDLASAENYLRKAIRQPGSDSLVRQNLALVVGLQGRFAEAEQIASAELPAEEARANIEYLRDMLTQQNAWRQLKKEES